MNAETKSLLVELKRELATSQLTSIDTAGKTYDQQIAKCCYRMAQERARQQDELSAILTSVDTCRSDSQLASANRELSPRLRSALQHNDPYTVLGLLVRAGTALRELYHGVLSRPLPRELTNLLRRHLGELDACQQRLAELRDQHGRQSFYPGRGSSCQLGAQG